jgi:hypothetical protein
MLVFDIMEIEQEIQRLNVYAKINNIKHEHFQYLNATLDGVIPI